MEDIGFEEQFLFDKKLADETRLIADVMGSRIKIRKFRWEELQAM